jgi:hypothetical protein
MVSRALTSPRITIHTDQKQWLRYNEVNTRTSLKVCGRLFSAAQWLARWNNRAECVLKVYSGAAVDSQAEPPNVYRTGDLSKTLANMVKA